MAHDLNLVRSVVADLFAEGFAVAVFGGWAEELHGLASAGEHGDIDLMIFDPDIRQLDTYISSRAEITAKHFSHKRAFTADGTLIELFIVRKVGSGGFTRFWDCLGDR